MSDNGENTTGGALDLHTEMPIPKIETTPEQRALFEKHFRTGTPVTDALRERLKDPKFAQEFADAGNALAAGLRANPIAAQDEGTPPPLPPEPLQVTRDLMTIEFADFEKVVLRVGTVISAERVPKKDKLLKLMVDFDEGSPRQVIAGIGKTFHPESLVGHQYVFVTNLAPREVLKGLLSKGMILATGPDDEHLVLVRPEVGVLNGARFR